MASFFIDRPIFAWVLAIVIMLAGGAATLLLRNQTLARLQVPVHAARSLAFTQVLEQDRSAALVGSDPGMNAHGVSFGLWGVKPAGFRTSGASRGSSR